jgi:hypothetical protein
VQAIRRHPVAAFTATILVIGLAWLWCTPPSDGQDEASHYVRMVGLSQGSLFGEAIDRDAPITDHFTNTPSVAASRRLNLESGTYRLPARAAPASACNQFVGGRPYDCPEAAPSNSARSFHARSLPTSYALPAVMSKLGTTTIAKSTLGRLGYLLQAVALLTLAGRAVAPVVQRRGYSFSLIALAVTPLATYQLATLSPSGTEWAAALAFAATFVRVLHDPRRRWIAACAATAVIATLTRDLGIVLVPMTAVIVVSAHAERAMAAVRAPRRIAPLIACVVAASVVAVAWRILVQAPSGTPEVSMSVAVAIVKHIASLSLFSVGRVGWLVTSSGLVVSVVWTAVGAVTVWRAVAGTRRRLFALLATGCCWVLLNAFLEASLRPTGFGVQARYALPILSVGLLAIATVAPVRLPSPRSERRTLLVCGVLNAVGHLTCMVTMIVRHTQGLWHGWPFTDPAWTPPVGWPSALLFIVGATALVIMVTCAAAMPSETRTLDGAVNDAS